MAPLRRYIRLTPHTTLQALIFLEDPTLLHTWLIHPTNPALPRIVDSLKDLILPKLREERERDNSSASAKKNKAVKDVVVGSDFEVSVFFKDGATKHSLITRRREFLGPKVEGGLRSNSSKMVQANDEPTAGATAAIGDSEGQDDGGGGLVNLRIENDEDDVDLDTLPLADPATLQGEGNSAGEIEMQGDADAVSVPAPRARRRKRVRGNVNDDDDDLAYAPPSGDEDRAENPATVSTRKKPQSTNRNAKKNSRGKGRKQQPITVDSGSESESEIGSGVARAATKDEKKPLFRHSYEAYTIYGKVLYLIVRKLDTKPAATRADQVPSTMVTRDIPIAPAIEGTGTAEEGILEGWMYMSQTIREELD